MRRGISMQALVFAAVLAAGSVRLPAAAPYSLLGQSAPDFTLRAIAGDNVRLSEHRGEVVAVAFWSSRCATCSAQLAALETSRRTFAAAGLRVLAVNVGDEPARAREFAAGQQLAFPLLLDPGKSVSRSYRVDSLPMLILVDRGGAIRHAQREHDRSIEAGYLRQLRALLNE